LDDFDLFDYTESFNEFDDDLNETLEDAELDALSKQISEIAEQEVNYSKKKMLVNLYLIIFLTDNRCL